MNRGLDRAPVAPRGCEVNAFAPLTGILSRVFAKDFLDRQGLGRIIQPVPNWREAR